MAKRQDTVVVGDFNGLCIYCQQVEFLICFEFYFLENQIVRKMTCDLILYWAVKELSFGKKYWMEWHSMEMG